MYLQLCFDSSQSRFSISGTPISSVIFLWHKFALHVIVRKAYVTQNIIVRKAYVSQNIFGLDLLIRKRCGDPIMTMGIINESIRQDKNDCVM
jgi:hypothetical protein